MQACLTDCAARAADDPERRWLRPDARVTYTDPQPGAGPVVAVVCEPIAGQEDPDPAWATIRIPVVDVAPKLRARTRSNAPSEPPLMADLDSGEPTTPAVVKVPINLLSPCVAESYSEKHVKRLLVQIGVSEEIYVGKGMVVRMGAITADIARWSEEDGGWTTERILTAAAALLRKGTRQMPVNTRDFHPEFSSDPDEQLDEVPEALQNFFSQLYYGKPDAKKLDSREKKTKVACAGQMARFVATSRKAKYLPSLLFHTTVHLSYKYASRCLVDSLAYIGVGVGRTHTRDYARVAAVHSKRVLPKNAADNNFHAKGVSDNADSIRSTLLGTDSFHQMGTTSTMMGVALDRTVFGLPRTKITTADVMALNPNPEVRYTGLQKFDSTVVHSTALKPASEYPTGDVFGPTMEALFRVSPVAGNGSLVHNAFMKHTHHNLPHAEPASIYFEQMINLNPGSATEGFSSVVSAMLQCREAYVEMGVTDYQICLDLPLFMKARIIVEWAKQFKADGVTQNHPELAKFHVVLGGFHT